MAYSLRIKFSIILPTFNREKIIRQAIDSVLSQDYSIWELIVVDDGSTDATNEVVSAYQDKRIKYFKLKSNEGVNEARNYGLMQSSGDYIVLLDSDNMLTVNILSYYYRLIKEKKYRYVKFPCISQDGYSTVVNTAFSGNIAYKEFLQERLKGEYATLIEADLLKKVSFVDGICGGESITWSLIAKEVKNIRYETKTALIYDDSRADRLSIKTKNYKRLSEVFAKDIQVLYLDYIKYAPLKLVEKVAKFCIYKLLAKE